MILLDFSIVSCYAALYAYTFTHCFIACVADTLQNARSAEFWGFHSFIY
jgi:hypothetical protein